MDAYERVTRNTVEVVTDEDLRALLLQPTKRVYAGYEPSGEIHLGHLVTINKLVDLQAAGFEVSSVLICLAYRGCSATRPSCNPSNSSARTAPGSMP